MSPCPWPAPHGEECSHRDRSDRSWSPRLLPLLLQGKSQSGLLLNWLTWYPPVFWWLIRDICTKIRSHYIFKHIDTMIGSRGRGHRATASHYWLVISSSPHWHTLPPLISPGTHQYSVTIMQAPVPENPPQVQGQGLFGHGSIQIMLTNESESILWNL